MPRLLAPLLIAAIAGMVSLPASAGSDLLDAKRPKVKVSTRVRTAPTLPSEEEEVEEPPSASSDSGWEDYYREKADFYRDKRKKEREYRSGGSCMYGTEGVIIYAPPGRDC